MNNPVSNDENPRTYKSEGIIKSGNFARSFPKWALHPNEAFPLAKEEVYSGNVGFRIVRSKR